MKRLLLAMLLSAPASADELMLGLWSQHYTDELASSNESHDLIGYAGDGYAVGTYKNSSDNRSYFAAWKSKESCPYENVCFDLLAGAVSGYEYEVLPIIVPRLKIGPVQIGGVPGVLMAAGFVIEF